MYQDRIQIDVPSRADSPLEHIFLRRLDKCIEARGVEKVGKHSVRHELRLCHDQKNGILCGSDAAVAAEIGVDAYVNLTGLKVNAAVGIMRESILQGELPFVVDPTPIPELSESGKLEVLSNVKKQLFEMDYTGELLPLIRDIKNTTLSAQREFAKSAADRMQTLITDQCIEGGWNNAMHQYLSDLCYYPYAVLHGPVPTRAARLVWQGDTLTTKYEQFYETKCISPFDFFWTPDSPDTQRGTGVFVRERWTRQQLIECSKMKSYNQKAVEEVLEILDLSETSTRYKWTSENPDTNDSKLWMLGWRDMGVTVEVIKHYGYFSGRELQKIGVQSVDANEFYNATLTVVSGKLIQVYVNKNPNVNYRPVHTTSFDKSTDRIPGEGIAQKGRDVERCYLVALRYLMRNAANASEPITEADYTRMVDYLANNDLGRVQAGTFYLTTSEIPQNNAPALRFHNVPSNMPGYVAVMNYFMDLMDRITNIPAALHGEPVGTGANRTFRGIALLQGNAYRAIQTAVGNMDQYVFKPYGELIYNYNMQYYDDEDVKGDCLVNAQGATGLLQREIDRQNAYEVLQTVTLLGANAETFTTQGLIQWAFNQVLRNMEVPEELLKTGIGQPMQQQGMIEQAPAIPQETAGAELVSEL